LKLLFVEEPSVQYRSASEISEILATAKSLCWVFICGVEVRTTPLYALSLELSTNGEAYGGWVVFSCQNR
jgi:hypothetical protein